VVDPRELATGPASLSDDAAAMSRAWRLIVASVLVGIAVTVPWSFELVDSTIGDSVANNLLGYDAKGAAIDGVGMGVVFAFISGLAGSFTACNIAAFSAIAPLSCQRRAMGDVLRPLGWLGLRRHRPRARLDGTGDAQGRARSAARPLRTAAARAGADHGRAHRRVSRRAPVPAVSQDVRVRRLVAAPSPRWLQSRPGRVTRFTAGALLIAGTFTLAYWVLRVPAAFGIGWWPSMPCPEDAYLTVRVPSMPPSRWPGTLQ
jgi:hypothetical protein